MCSCTKQGGRRCQGDACWGDTPLASITFDPQAVNLPTSIILPLPVANRSKSSRKLVLTEPIMRLPIPIVDYINSHPVYGHWVAA